jgi:phosphocarrier protein FPr
MDILTTNTIRLQAQASDRTDAIQQAGELLVQGGCVEPSYINGMLAREETMSTYLGNGVSIPHGQYEDLSLIHRTGISVLQLPQGVEWEPGEVAYLVIGIAARSDEHVGVLSNLAEVIEDAETTQQLVYTTDPEMIVKCLNRPQNDGS